MPLIHAELLPSIAVWVEKSFLFGMDPAFIGQYEPGNIFSLSSYPGEAITFQVLLNNGCLFSYLPIHALAHNDGLTDTPLQLQDLLYNNCPAKEICVHAFQHLQGEVTVYLKYQDRWIKGSYLLTVDWYTKNENGHLIALQNGQFALVPNHKIKFRNIGEGFPPYRTLKQQWVL